MSNQTQVARQKPGALMQNFLDNSAIQKQLMQTLGEKRRQFVSSLVTAYSDSDSTLKECRPQDVYMQALKVAQLDLPLDKQLGFAYLIPFKNKKRGITEPVLVIGYKGLIQLAQRSGQFKCINGGVVYEGELARTDKLTGSIDLSGARTSDTVVGYFAHMELINGFQKTVYMSLEQIAHYAKTYVMTLRNVSKEDLIKKAGEAPTGIGWYGDFDTMAQKTCMRQLLMKWAPLSIEMVQALKEDPEETGDGTTRDEVLGDYEVLNVDTETGEILEENTEQISDSGAVIAAPEDEPSF